jgi:hypothetical protein
MGRIDIVPDLFGLRLFFLLDGDLLPPGLVLSNDTCRLRSPSVD